jgi:hypothetical protein
MTSSELRQSLPQFKAVDFLGRTDTWDVMVYACLDEQRTIRYLEKMLQYVLSFIVLQSYMFHKENV